MFENPNRAPFRVARSLLTISIIVIVTDASGSQQDVQYLTDDIFKHISRNNYFITWFPLGLLLMVKISIISCNGFVQAISWSNYDAVN